MFACVRHLFVQNVSLYEPLQIVSYQIEKNRSDAKKYLPDAYLTLSWKGKKFKFSVEVTGNLYLEAKLARIKEKISDFTEFLIVVPYITKGISEIVKRQHELRTAIDKIVAEIESEK